MASKTSRSTSEIIEEEEEEEDNHYHGGGSGSNWIDNMYQLIKEELNFLEESFQETKRRADQLIVQIKDVRHKSEQLRRGQGGGEIEIELQELKKTVSKLKSKIPFNFITPEDVPNPNVNWRPRINPKHRPTRKPLVYRFMDDDHHPTYQDLLSSFRGLDYSPKIDLLMAFLVFPERAFIKKSLLACFFMAAKSTESYATELFALDQAIEELISQGFIKSVYKNCSRTVSGFWMHPFVRSTLQDHVPTDWPGGIQRFLVNSIGDDEDIIYDGSAEYSTMRDLQFLHLGNWEGSPTHHIEMETPQVFFKYIKNMRRLRYISFRGVSMITELPKFITKLYELKILDLKACHNLEVIPSDIGNLQRCLTHLDMSECYFLDRMPASLSQLVNLTVLKGFLVRETNRGESCTLQDLSSLKELIKLNIYTSVVTFPDEDDIKTLREFKSLRELTISWGGCSATRQKFTYRPWKHIISYQLKLKKLDLQCVPSELVTCDWLTPVNFKHLEKLYIRGGQLRRLEDIVDGPWTWSVEILRLKHLSKLQMDWSQLQRLFPKLVSVEKVDCPNLTSFPCDDSGLWTRDTAQPPAASSL